ncbi:MAG: archease [Candidatus Odinarchaeota archaeon]|nr:archease [Candidatus Odinarchaeota archaeon]
MGSYTFLEHTADVYVKVEAKSLEEAFEYCAKAMFEVMTDTSKVRKVEEREVEVSGSDIYMLLYNWLEELLIYYDSENIVFSEFKVRRIKKKDGGYSLSASAYGEPFDKKRHESRTEVKAITFNMMEIDKSDEGYVVKFVLDI